MSFVKITKKQAEQIGRIAISDSEVIDALSTPLTDGTYAVNKNCLAAIAEHKEINLNLPLYSMEEIKALLPNPPLNGIIS